MKNRVRELCEQRAINTAYQFYMKTSLPRATCYRLWNGEDTGITYLTLAYLAAFFGVRLDDLFEHVELPREEIVSA